MKKGASKREKIRAQYYTFTLDRRDGVYYADGRAAKVGRHSLGTRERQEAEDRLRQLDLKLAVQAGLADPAVLKSSQQEARTLRDAADEYLREVGRGVMFGGAKPQSVKRYRPVFGKFLEYVQGLGVTRCNQLATSVVVGYADSLDREGYAYRTRYLEITTLKQFAKFLAKRGYLAKELSIDLPLRKPSGTSTYCWRRAEVEAMLEHCAAARNEWMREVILALAYTGMWISELAGLRWADLDLDESNLQITDENSRRTAGRDPRSTKGRRSRSLPLHEELRAVLRTKPRLGDGYVFHGPRGGRLKPDTVRNIFIRDVIGPLADRFPSERGDLGFRDGRLHSFRHFFCSWCANQGVPQQTLMLWLGHRDSEMVNHYYHLHDHEAKRQMDNLRLAEGVPTTGVGTDVSSCCRGGRGPVGGGDATI